MNQEEKLQVTLAQIAPVWLNKSLTIEKIINNIIEAGKLKSDLIVFGEGLLPGYPYWLSLTHGSEFNSNIQKEIHAHYLKNSVQIEKGDLDEICKICNQYSISTYLGTVERAEDRGGHSLYCSLVYINKSGSIESVHRKLQPTYEERLTWASGDGNGLTVHNLNNFKLGGLNCWENWMPLARTSLYAQGENVHIAVWPGSNTNTNDITRFIAKESRSFVISVSGLMKKTDFPTSTPHLDIITEKAPEVLSNGGSCVAAPDGSWLLEPVIDKEGLFTVELDLNIILKERQNFDPSGHYSRPDITELIVNRKRQTIVKFI